MQLRARARLLWLGWTTSPSLSDGDLAAATRQVTKAVAQTINNRAFRRPALGAANPRQTAVEQREFDHETLDQYHERIAAELDPVRDEFIARGQWTPELDELATNPTTVADLRDLVIHLHDLASSLDTADG